MIIDNEDRTSTIHMTVPPIVAKNFVKGRMPEKVIALVNEAIARSSQVAVAEETGLSRLTIQRCSQGIGEPSQETLQRLANYFKETFVLEIKPRR